MSRIRAMIVEDSPVARRCLELVIARDARLEVVASVASAEEAISVLYRASPDVITMDIRLPGMNGYEATRRIMQDRPTPIVVVSATNATDSETTINALRAGALTAIEKPSGVSVEGFEAVAERLCTQLVVMSKVKVVRQRMRRHARTSDVSQDKAHLRSPRRAPPRDGYRVLGIVASTGGPNAVRTVLGGLGDKFPVPIVLVQHITSSFLPGFVSWLDGVSPMPVAIARDGDVPQSGHVYVAPPDEHLAIRRGRLALHDGEPVSSQRPSGTVLLESLVEYGPQALGVLLTGMGDDGAAGLKSMCDAGAYTITEHESTAVVYGMPAAAVRMGASCESLPLDDIGQQLNRLVHRSEQRP